MKPKTHFCHCSGHGSITLLGTHPLLKTKLPTVLQAALSFKTSKYVYSQEPNILSTSRQRNKITDGQQKWQQQSYI